nr:hypothetical protein [Tanacetum cinerariifolium]
MILEFVENGPLIWPTIKENGVTRPRKYNELTHAKALQADCNVKATNITLQGLPNEIYALVSHHKVAKDLWERIQLLMQGTSFTKEKRECKLYDEFDKFTYKKRETLRDFYLRFSLLLNDLNLYNDLHTTNIDQLHAYLEQHEFHANKVRLMHERNSDPLAFIATYQMTQSLYQTHQNSYQNSQFHLQFSQYQSQHHSPNKSLTPFSLTYPYNDYQSSVCHNVYSPQPSIPQLEYVPTVNQQQSELSPLHLGLNVPVFKHGDDPIDSINYMMQQATINDGRVTLQPIQGRKISFATGKRRTYTPAASGSNSGKQRTAICYNCKGEGHMSKQSTKPKRKRNDSWLKDKVLLVQAQANGQILHEEELAFLVDPGLLEANLSHYGSDTLTEVHNPDNVDNSMINQGVQVMLSSEQSNVVNRSEIEITSDSNIIPYSHYCSQNDFKKEESRNIDRESALEKKIKHLDNIVYKGDQSSQTVHMLTKPKFLYDHSTKQALCFQNPFYLKKAWKLEPKLYDGNVIKNTCAIVILDFKETLMHTEESRSKNDFKTTRSNDFRKEDPNPSKRPTKVDVPKELPKVSMVNTSLKKLKHHLAGFDVVVEERTMPTTITDGSWGFKHTKACFRDEIILFVKALKDLFNTFDQYLIDERTDVQNVFHQMEQAMEQHRLKSKTFKIKMNQVLNENERLLEQVINKDIVNIVVNSSVDNASVSMHECEKCLKLKTELLNKNDFIKIEIYNKLFKSYTTLEKHCISLEVDTQLNQEIFQRDNSVSNQSAPRFGQYFELNELKAQSQEKDTVIKKLKERIKSLSRNMNKDEVKKDDNPFLSLYYKYVYKYKHRRKRNVQR